MDRQALIFDEKPPHSIKLSLASWLGIALGGTFLLTGIVWLGQVVNTGSDPVVPRRVDDPARALVVIVNPATSDVRVLNVRDGISEVVRFHDPRRQGVRSLALDKTRRWLSVQADDANYVYDMSNFKLQRRDATIAEQADAGRITLN